MFLSFFLFFKVFPKSTLPAELLDQVELEAELLNPVNPGTEILPQVETKKNDFMFLQGLDSSHGESFSCENCFPHYQDTHQQGVAREQRFVGPASSC